MTTPAGRLRLLSVLIALAALLSSACNPRGAGSESLTVYSGRVEHLVGPLIERFGRESGVDVRVRYGDSAELAATILEEGANSPADVFFSQDAGSLGAIAQRNVFATLPDAILGKVDPKYRSPQGQWVGVNGRARVAAYNTVVVQEVDLPDSVLGFADPRWRGRVGWVPTNGSFQAFVTALRRTDGDAAAHQWLEAMKANDTRAYPNNTAAVKAVAAREIHVALVNHYYMFAVEKDAGPIPVRNYHPRDGKTGALLNVAGIGILTTSKNQEAARRFVEFLLSRPAQEYFVRETFEYPLVAGVAPPAGAVPLTQIRTPALDLSSLADLEGTLRLLRESGVL